MKIFQLITVKALSIFLFSLFSAPALFAQWHSLDGPRLQAGGYSCDIGIIDNRAFILDDLEPTWDIAYGLFEITNNGKELTRVENIGILTSGGGFASDDQTIFLGITGGILISNDKGNTWESYQYSIFGTEGVAALLVKGDTLLAHSAGHFFRSYDHGITWNQISGKSMQNINGSNIIIVGQDLFMLAYHDLLKSSDWGENWVSIGNSWPSTLDLLYDGSRLFILCESGLYISDDQGLTFTFQNPGFYWLNTITRKDNFLLIGTSLNDRIYRSDDNGITWIGYPNELIDNYVLELASTNNIVYAGLMNGYVFSSDNGENWDVVNSTPVTANKILKKDSLIYAGTPSGLFYYSPADSTWKVINKNLELNGINDFIVQNTSIYTANDEGIYKSDNLGQSWNLLGLPYYSAKTLAKFNNDMLVGTNRDGIFYTGTDGLLWITRNSGLPTIDEYGNFNPIITSVINDSVALIGIEGNGIYRSENRGIIWEKCNGIGNDTIRKIIQAAGDYYAGTQAGVYISSDYGINWIKLPDPPLSSDVSDLFYNGDNIFVSLRHGGVNIWNKATNTWITLNGGIPTFNVTSLTGDSNDLVISTISKGIYTRRIKNYLGVDISPELSPEIYPNPCQSTLCIKTRTSFSKNPHIEILTMEGKTAIAKTFSAINGSVLLDVSQLKPGIYLVRLFTGKGYETFKFIKTI